MRRFSRSRAITVGIAVFLALALVVLGVVLAETLGSDCAKGTTRTKGVCVPDRQLQK